MNKMKKPELLSPAGSFDSMRAAVNAGCDAVYFGGKSFNARAGAANIDDEAIPKAIDYCKSRGVKAYVTVNSLYKEEEFPGLYRFLKDIYREGADAAIVADMGAAEMIRAEFPDLALYASAQMTVCSTDDVRFLQSAGFKRAVLSRELSLEEIKTIILETGIETECFVHGALCVCYSGQCLFSSLLGGRSGNRGRCAQPCRLNYELYENERRLESGHLLSPKDLNALKSLPSLIAAGATSFKIEGRMKSPEYAAGTTAIYRKYIDLAMENGSFVIEEKDWKTLLQLFNRGGFTDGYLSRYGGKSMMSPQQSKNWGTYLGEVAKWDERAQKCLIDIEEDVVPGDGLEIWTQDTPHIGSYISRPAKAGDRIAIVKSGAQKGDKVYKSYDKRLMDQLKVYYEKDTRQMDAAARGVFRKGEPIRVEIFKEGVFAQAIGEPPAPAEKAPLSRERVLAQMNKTGNSPCRFTQIDLQMDDDIFLPLSKINELRRAAMELFEKNYKERYKRAEIQKDYLPEKYEKIHTGEKQTTVLTDDKSIARQAIATGVGRVYLEPALWARENLDDLINQKDKKNVQIYIALPAIMRDEDKKRYWPEIERLAQKDIDGFLARTLGEFYSVKELGKPVAADYTLNVFNARSYHFWLSQGAESVALSPELTLYEGDGFADDRGEITVYGRLPLMTTVQCPAGTDREGKYCKKKGSGAQYFLKDRKAMTFLLKRNCDDCVTQILNSQPIFVLNYFDTFLERAPGKFRLVFTNEDEGMGGRIIDCYDQALYGIESKYAKGLTERMKRIGCTKGHFFRGVE